MIMLPVCFGYYLYSSAAPQFQKLLPVYYYLQNLPVR